MKFHFSFSFSSTEVVFFPWCFTSSQFSRRLRMHRESIWLKLNKARLTLFFVFISATSVKADIIAENIRWETSANVFFPDSVVWIDITIFFCSGKSENDLSVRTFLYTALGHSFYSLCGCPSFSVPLQRKYVFGMSFLFFCLIRLHLFFRSWTPFFFPEKRFFIDF